LAGRLGERVAALGGAAATRGARFVARAEGRPIAGVSALAAVPAWHGWSAPRRARLGAAAALLGHRAALDRELSAARLGPLAALVGESLFDAICEAPRPDGEDGRPLPSPSEIGAMGQDLLARALPAVLGGAGDAHAARLVRQAADLVAAREAQA